ncbi:hypothetical protein L8C07_13050 [Paenibacillus sp. CMAA1739]|uniref:hypothetical protein n=1 Tax=Paenibacillus ottowii TaxID=2315729 RepID=UPI002DB57445|nr:hypothetical protein [Paenibacillus sp. CMAA1739]MEC4566871.1 hypothetical protein [Paenibacillus sp. CMAA1739]
MKTLKRNVISGNVVTITIITVTIVIMNVIVVTTNSTKLKIVGGGARLPAFF